MVEVNKATEVNKAAYEWLRLASTRARLDASLRLDRPQLTAEALKSLVVLREQLQEDLDLEDDPRYAAMVSDLRSRLDPRLFDKALYHPEALSGGRAYPVYASELANLCAALGVPVHGKTIERLATDGLITPPLLVGTRSLLRPIYFARHLVEVLYEQLVVDLKPDRGKAYLHVLAGRLSDSELLYLSGLPGVQDEWVEKSAAEAADRVRAIRRRQQA